MSPKSPGFAALIDLFEARRAPIDCAPGEGLPDADVALGPLTLYIVEDPDDDPDHQPPFRSAFHRKDHAIRKELRGLSELCALHALLIAHLRKRSFPDHAPYLFHRLWDEHADHLIDHLDPRWLVSAITTFGDHGLTQTQRATGLALSTLFGMMKLYETERLYSGLTPRQPYPSAKRQRASLPLEMDPYALVGGGLDVNTLARLWQEAETDLVIAPLAHHLLHLLLTDDRGLFQRLALMRTEKETQRADRQAKLAPEPDPEPAPPVQSRAPTQPPAATPPSAKPAAAIAPVIGAPVIGAPVTGAPVTDASVTGAPVTDAHMPTDARTLRWGVVSTIKAPLPQIARFAAHHIDMGADALHIYLDEADPDTQAFLSQHPKIHVTPCDAAYWTGHGKKRPHAHQLRQPFNATRCLHGPGADLHWLAHIDVDEFLLTDAPLRDLLFGAPRDAAFARIPPAEALARDDGTPMHFKLSHEQAGVKKSDLQDIYPTFGMHLYGGFVSHTSGKILARTGIRDTRLGIHALKFAGQAAENQCTLDGLLLAHLHSPSWDHFLAHLDFRLTKGSYRSRTERFELGQSAILGYLQQEEGETGLRTFFDEVCADTPELRQRLSDHGMLITRDLDLDAKVRRVFGTLPWP